MPLTSGSAQPWKHKAPVRRCRPGNGWALAWPTGRPGCATHAREKTRGSEGEPQLAKVRSGSRWPPGRGKGGCSPSR